MVCMCPFTYCYITKQIELFRSLLEENAIRQKRMLYDWLTDLIPFVFAQEQDSLKMEISNRYLSVIFDGTTMFGEAMATVVRYVDNDWNIQQRLIRLKLLQKSMTGEEIAQVVMDTLLENMVFYPIVFWPA